MTCREIVEFLDQYLDGTLAPSCLQRFEAHLAECEHCRNYLGSYQQTIVISRVALTAHDDPSTTNVPADLVRAILNARRRDA